MQKFLHPHNFGKFLNLPITSRNEKEKILKNIFFLKKIWVTCRNFCIIFWGLPFKSTFYFNERRKFKELPKVNNLTDILEFDFMLGHEEIKDYLELIEFTFRDISFEINPHQKHPDVITFKNFHI